jgi:hypothetical protein
MADDRTDPRDEALARALAVEPLDELTRRRLVSGALAATPVGASGASDAGSVQRGTGRARILGVAAATVAFVVLGVAALALPRNDTTDVAGRVPQSRTDQAASAPEPAATKAPTAESATPSAAGSTGSSTAADSARAVTALPDLGRLGEVGTVGSRERVVATAAPIVDGVAPRRWAFTFQTCPPHTVDAVATGLGSIDGDPVFVVVSRRDDGSLRVRAIDGTSCAVRSLP